MAVFKCKMCGGDLNIQEGLVVCECEYCGTKQTIPTLDNEKKLNLFNRANNLRFKNEFDKAAGIYENIIAEFHDEAEAYWGLVLCKYGIEYVDDKDGKKIPTCHRTLPTPIMRDEDFQQACEYADIVAKGVYREEAKAIDAIQKKILEIAANEEPYDIFICYKETDDLTGARTEDSSIAQDIYTAFTELGYKVFYARNSLRRVAGTEYEPYIYAALSSSRVMLAIGTKYDYYDSVWVKNEWSRFIAMMGDDSTKILIPCFRDMDAYDMPEEFSNMQALDMADMMFFTSLEASVKRIRAIGNKTIVTESVATNGANTSVEPLLKRAYIFLEDGMWDTAREYSEKVLDIDPENANAYLCKLLADLKVSSKEELKNQPAFFNDNINYQKVVKYADVELRAEIIGYLNDIHRRLAEEKETALQNIKQKRKQLRRMYQGRLAAGRWNSAALKSDGTVVAAGSNYDGQCNVENWHGIVALSAGMDHLVGLKTDGTVVAAGATADGQSNVQTPEWSNIIAVSACNTYTLGLKTDGTVVATPYIKRFMTYDFGEREVGGWRDIIAISTGGTHSVGLRSDGTVVAVGNNSEGQCNVSDWKDIVAIATGGNCTIGLKSDGTVCLACKNAGKYPGVSSWKDVASVSANYKHIVALKTDGTVVASGKNKEGQCEVNKWDNIVAISAGRFHTMGLKKDGTIVVAGDSGDSKSDMKKWQLFLGASEKSN